MPQGNSMTDRRDAGGAALALTEVALQAMVRNVLADPSILGVTSGASTGAAASILLGAGAALFCAPPSPT